MYKHINSKGVIYYLHARPAVHGGKMLYFFSKVVKDGVQKELPAGYVVSETRNGLPVLKKA